MKIWLKPATADDANTYSCIAKNVESPINTAITDYATVIEEIRRSNVFIIVCNAFGVGYISYERRSATSAYISELAVHSTFQGRGIGNQALDMLLSCLYHEGFDHFELATHPDNRARKLYEEKGFVVTGRMENYEDSGTPRLIMQMRS